MNDSPANTEEIAELLVYLGGHADRCRIRPDGGAMDSHAVFSRAPIDWTPSAFATALRQRRGHCIANHQIFNAKGHLVRHIRQSVTVAAFSVEPDVTAGRQSCAVILCIT
jgi:hypothetical protein